MKKAQYINSITLKKTKTDIPAIKISSSQDSYNEIRRYYFDDIGIFESFFLLLLNRADITIGYAKISQGGTAGTVIDIKIIAKYCLEGLASGAIIAHNHPSGNINPSETDLASTRKIKNALELLEISLLDHIILSGTEEGKYTSMADEYLL